MWGVWAPLQDQPGGLGFLSGARCAPRALFLPLDVAWPCVRPAQVRTQAWGLLWIWGHQPQARGPRPHRSAGNPPKVGRCQCPSPRPSLQNCRWPPWTPLGLRMSQVVLTDPPLGSCWAGDPGTARPLCGKCLEGAGETGWPEDPGREPAALSVSRGEWPTFASSSPGNRGGCCLQAGLPVLGGHRARLAVPGVGRCRRLGSFVGLQPMASDDQEALRARGRARHHTRGTRPNQVPRAGVRAERGPASHVLWHPRVGGKDSGMWTRRGCGRRPDLRARVVGGVSRGRAGGGQRLCPRAGQWWTETPPSGCWSLEKPPASACLGDTLARGTEPPLSRVPLGAAAEKPHVQTRGGARAEDGEVHGAPPLRVTVLRGGACRTAGGLGQPSWLLGGRKRQLCGSRRRGLLSPCSAQDVTGHRGGTWCYVQAAPAPHLAFVFLCGEAVK